MRKRLQDITDPPPILLDYRSSAFAHALGRFARAARAHLVLDPLAVIGVDALPVMERAAQHRLAHAAEQAAGAPVLIVEPVGVLLMASSSFTGFRHTHINALLRSLVGTG